MTADQYGPNTTRVLQEVAAERWSQDRKWGEQNHHPVYWLAVLTEELGEAAKEIVKAMADPVDGLGRLDRLRLARAELIQTAAVAVSMIESMDRNELAAPNAGSAA